MKGSKARKEEEWRWGQRPAPLAGARGFQLWRSAMAWQRAVEAALGPSGLTHTQYLVLATVEQLMHEIQDAVSQQAIARRAGVDPVTTSRVLRALELRGLCSRGPCGVDTRELRVGISGEGLALVHDAGPSVEAAQLAFFAT